MTSSILSISLTGLNAAQAGIRTTQHNIANVNTTGFHRQSVNYANTTPYYSGSALMGSGVEVDGVSRIYDRFLENELLLSQTQLSRYDVYSGYASQVDRLLGDPYTGLSSAFSSFFAAVNEVANDPTSVSARQMMLTSGQTLAGRVNNLDATLEGMQKSLDQQMDAVTKQVTDYASQIAKLSDQIAIVEGSTGQVANDLRDMREQVTGEINKLINVTSYTQADGTYTLYIGSGQPLVVGNRASALTTMPDPADPERKVPALEVNGVQIPLDTDLITGGQLGGMLSFRSEILTSAQTKLATLAVEFANAFNAQHESGYDLDGDTNQAFFAVPDPADPVTDYPRLMRVLLTNTYDIAAAGTDAPGDNTNALALAALQTDKIMNGGTATFQAYYGQVVSETASKANAADASQQAYEVLTRQAYEAQQSVSGVNLDEEAANLIRFQQAYQAAAKAMQVASSLFDEVLAIGR